MQSANAESDEPTLETVSLRQADTDALAISNVSRSGLSTVSEGMDNNCSSGERSGGLCASSKRGSVYKRRTYSGRRIPEERT